jgi:hypothetical protein
MRESWPRRCLDPVDEGNPLWDDPVRYPSVAPELIQELSIPLLFIGAELGSVLVTFSPCAPKDENYQRFYEAANPPAIEITQLDVGHGQYVDEGAARADDPCALGDVPSDWVRSSSAAYLTAFFLWTLMDSEAALAWLDARLAQDEADGRIAVRRKWSQRTGCRRTRVLRACLLRPDGPLAGQVPSFSFGEQSRGRRTVDLENQ